ncbi:hypothetical protein P4S72_08700 [Vibrio sp. PP-XX7]
MASLLVLHQEKILGRDLLTHYLAVATNHDAQVCVVFSYIYLLLGAPCLLNWNGADIIENVERHLTNFTVNSVAQIVDGFLYFSTIWKYCVHVGSVLLPSSHEKYELEK